MSYFGMFDSGLGGLSILRALYHRFPFENFVYLADGQNLPYGEKSKDVLQQIYNKNINYFSDSKGVVVACNTMSCFIDNNIQTDMPIISIIDSLIISINKYYKDVKSLGILGTEYTINSHTYIDRLHQTDNKYSLHQVAAPLLASAIENDDENTWNICKQYIDQFPKGISHLILACTHYNLLFEKIRQEYPHLVIIDPYRQIIHQADMIVQADHDNTKKPIRFLTTKYTDILQKKSEEIMQQPILWETINI